VGLVRVWLGFCLAVWVTVVLSVCGWVWVVLLSVWGWLVFGWGFCIAVWVTVVRSVCGWVLVGFA
jgi:hypothetical protein